MLSVSVQHCGSISVAVVFWMGARRPGEVGAELFQISKRFNGIFMDRMNVGAEFVSQGLAFPINMYLSAGTRLHLYRRSGDQIRGLVYFNERGEGC